MIYQLLLLIFTYDHEIESESLATGDPAHLILQQIQSDRRWRHLWADRWRHLHVVAFLRQPTCLQFIQNRNYKKILIH